MTCNALEPGLVFPDDVTRQEWLLRRAELSFKLGAWQNRNVLPEPAVAIIKPEVFITLHKLAKDYWRGPAGDGVREFPFMNDAALRSIAERDYVSLGNAAKASDAKPAVVTAGSVIEAILLDLLERDKTKALAAPAAVIKAEQAKDPKWNARVQETSTSGTSLK